MEPQKKFQLNPLNKDIYSDPHSFLGISIVSDLFMSAIEKITSKTKEIHIAGSDPSTPADVIEVPVDIHNLSCLDLKAS